MGQEQGAHYPALFKTFDKERVRLLENATGVYERARAGPRVGVKRAARDCAAHGLATLVVLWRAIGP